MQAIVVKYLPATNYKGARLKAYADGGSVTISYPYELNRGEGYRHVAELLRAKLGWNAPNYGRLIEGGLPKHGGRVFVMDAFGADGQE